MALAASEEVEDEEELLSGGAGEGRWLLGLVNSSLNVEGLGPPAAPAGLLLTAIRSASNHKTTSASTDAAANRRAESRLILHHHQRRRCAVEQSCRNR
jgi:hypothetical protein